MKKTLMAAIFSATSAMADISEHVKTVENLGQYPGELIGSLIETQVSGEGQEFGKLFRERVSYRGIPDEIIEGFLGNIPEAGSFTLWFLTLTDVTLLTAWVSAVTRQIAQEEPEIALPSQDIREKYKRKVEACSRELVLSFIVNDWMTEEEAAKTVLEWNRIKGRLPTQLVKLLDALLELKGEYAKGYLRHFEHVVDHLKVLFPSESVSEAPKTGEGTNEGNQD